MADLAETLRGAIREVPDFPKAGINFFDITTLLLDPGLFGRSVDAFAERFAGYDLDAIVAIEARGFIFGAPIALALGIPFVPIRKPGKLPAKVEHISYSLEYGEDRLEVHTDAVPPGAKVLIIDDLIATGGTVRAVVDLLERLSVVVVECAFLVELTFLNGRRVLGDTPVFSLVQFDAE